MTREEYMAKLQKYLRKLPKQDYEDAIDYFNEYFIAAFGVLLIGGKLLLRGLVSFPYSLSGALTVTGCGLFGIGCAILLYILGIYLCKWTGMLLVKLAQVLAGKRGKNHEKNK